MKFTYGIIFLLLTVFLPSTFAHQNTIDQVTAAQVSNSDSDWQWSYVELVSAESTDPLFSPGVVIDSDYNVHVVWNDNTDYDGAGADPDIFYKKYDRESSSWSSTVVLSTESTGSSVYLDIAIDSKDNLYVVWEDQTDYNGAGSDWDIFYKKYDSESSSWSSTVVLSTESTGASVAPSIAIDSTDIAHIVWRDNTDYNDVGSDYDIFYKTYEPRLSSWGSTVVLSTESSETTFSPDIAIDSKDNLYVAWED